MNSTLKKLRALWADQRPFSTRLRLAACAMLALCFTFIFFGPYEQVAFNGSSFAYQHDEVLLPMAAAMLTCTAAGALLLSLLRGKLFNYAVSAVFSAGLCCYLQGSLLNGSLGLLNGNAVDWTGKQSEMLIGLAVWFAVFFAVYMTLYLNRRVWRALVTYASLLLVFMQLVPAVCIGAGLYEETKASPISEYSFLNTGMYDFSKEDNLFVFVLDRLDYDYIDQTLKVKPDLLDGLDGFIHYTNAISTYARTRPALNHILTGYEETAYRSLRDEYFDISWTANDRNILGDLADRGYSIEIYAQIQDLFSNPDYANRYVKNISNGKEKLLPFNLFKRMVFLSCYRYLPVALKPFFLKDTNYYNIDVFADVPTYLIDDALHAPGFDHITADREQSAFKFYHFNGPHAPYILTEDAQLNENGTSLEAQMIGSFHILYTIFDQMKQLGIYEDAAILITADHGDAIKDELPLTKATRIGLFYKPSGSAGTPPVRSAAQVSTRNIPATLLKAAGADYSRYGTPLDEIGEDEAVTREYFKVVATADALEELEVYTYEITGDASIYENWKQTDYLKIERPHQFY